MAVKIVQRNRTPMIKIYEVKDNNHKSELENPFAKILLELHLMRKVNHVDGAIKLLDYYDSPDSYVFVLERLGTSALAPEIYSISSQTKDR